MELRILLIEDVPTDAELEVRELKRAGLRVVHRIVDTEEAFRLALREFRPEIIISDFTMPHFDGMFALTLARELAPDVPFIFVSGTIGEEYAIRALKNGATDYVLKNNLVRLPAAVERALQESAERAARLKTERELEETRSRLDSIVSSLSDVVWSYSLRDKRLLYVSTAIEEIFGWPAAEFYENPGRWLETIHPDDRVRVRAEREAGLAAGRFESVFRIVLRDGGLRWIQDRARVIFDEDGRPVQLDGLARDITQVKEQEARIERLSRIRAVLSGINSAIVRIRDRQQLFDEACRIALEHGGFGMAWIGLFDPATQEVTPVAWAGLEASEYLGGVKSTIRDDLPQGRGVLAQAIRSRKPAFDNDITLDPAVGGKRRAEAIRRGYRSVVILPLIAEGEVMGTLSLFAKELNFFDDEELKLLTELAGDVSFALEHIAGQEKIEKLSRIRVVSSGINAAIVRIREREGLLRETCRIASEEGRFEMIWIGTIDSEKQEVRAVAWSGFSEETAHAVDWASIGVARGPVGEAIQSKKVAVRNDIEATMPTGVLRKVALQRGCLSSVCMPLEVEGRVAALIVLFATGRGLFVEDELALLGEMASNISFALESIARQEKIERLSRIRTVLGQMNSAIVRIRDRQKLFEEACRIAVEHGRFAMAWIGMLDETTQALRPVAKAGREEGYLERIKLTIDPNATKNLAMGVEALARRVPVVCNDIATDGRMRPWRTAALERGYRSTVVLPLLLEQRAVGVFALYSPEPGFFDAEEMKLLVELAGDISFALEHIASQEKLDKLSRIRMVSGEINAAIVRIRERETLLRETCRIAAEHGKFELVWVGLLDEEKKEVKPVAWAGFSEDTARAVNWASISTSKGTLGEAIQTRKPSVRNDIEAELPGGKLRQEALQKGCRSTVSLPLVVDDNAVALILLGAPGVGFFDEEELALLNEVAADVSFALQSISRQEKLDYLSYYDPLSGLPNRTLFNDRLDQRVNAARRDQETFLVVMLDVERFRNINEILGRAAGDGLLREVAKRLKSAAHETDILGHRGGDQFAIATRRTADAGEVAHILDQFLTTTFGHPFEAGGAALRLASRAGVAVYPHDGADADSLLRNAEAALRNAKSAGETYQFYAPQMNASVAETLRLESRMREALEREQFVLHYQPKVDLARGTISGLEALIRWNDPETGLVPPAKFIPLLEETGLILNVGRWAIRNALEELRKWAVQGLQPPRVAVNVSAVQLRQKDFVDMVREAIGEAAGGSHGLDLEITESLIMADVEGNIAKLRAIRDLGVNVFIDDFGTGYSSLSYLAKLPIMALKIDRSFIVAMTSVPDNMNIVSTIVSLAHSMNLKVIAEGVETEEQANLLRLLRCDEAQGYLFGRPVPPDELEGKLRQA